MSQLKVLSFGAGAIGTYVGGSLALGGAQLVFVEQRQVIDDLKQGGLRLDLTLDRKRNRIDAEMLDRASFVAVATIEEALGSGPFDVAIFALKSYDTAAAVAAMQPFAQHLPPVWCLSNGVDNESALSAVLGPQRVIAGTVTSAIGRRGPGDIILERLRGVGIGGMHPVSAWLLSAANSAGLNARTFASASAMKWSKLLTNLIANPSSAILDMTPAQILAEPALYAIEIGMLRECLAVMKAQAIPVVDLPGTPVRALAFATRLPFWISKPLLLRAAGTGRGSKMPSFHIDLHSGRGKSEVEYLHGAVVRAGKKFGVPTPINQVLTETLMTLTRGGMPLSEYAHQPAKLVAAVRSRTKHT